MNISDIAKRANVSKSAVSIALNNKPGISDATRENILAIVKETGYKHRSMVGTQSVKRENKILRLLACVNADNTSSQYSTTSFFTELIHDLEKHSRLLGYTLVFSIIKIEDLEEEIHALEKLYSSDGIILLATNLNSDEIQIISKAQNNIVVMDNYSSFYEQNIVVMDNEMGVFKAISYLAELGHKRIGYVQSSLRLANFQKRKEGFKKALEHFKITPLKCDFEVDTTRDDAKNQFQELLNNCDEKLPTAFFCECDYIAIDVIKAIQAAGMSVPNDISVIGFDNVPEAMIISPELTTINVFRDNMAEIAVDRVVKLIKKIDTSKIKSMVNTELIIRDSCKQIG